MLVRDRDEPCHPLHRDRKGKGTEESTKQREKTSTLHHDCACGPLVASIFITAMSAVQAASTISSMVQAAEQHISRIGLLRVLLVRTTAPMWVGMQQCTGVPLGMGDFIDVLCRYSAIF